MKIYIFAPSKEWMYMGGAIVVIADSPERGMELAVKYDESLSTSQNPTTVEVIKWPCHWLLGEKNQEGNEVWHLVEQFDTTETKERIVLIDYNEA